MLRILSKPVVINADTKKEANDKLENILSNVKKQYDTDNVEINYKEIDEQKNNEGSIISFCIKAVINITIKNSSKYLDEVND